MTYRPDQLGHISSAFDQVVLRRDWRLINAYIIIYPLRLAVNGTVSTGYVYCSLFHTAITTVSRPQRNDSP